MRFRASWRMTLRSGHLLDLLPVHLLPDPRRHPQTARLLLQRRSRVLPLVLAHQPLLLVMTREMLRPLAQARQAARLRGQRVARRTAVARRT